ncbi:MAG: Crp/Fnr family transcriptional regulator [Adlercreutzia sp.]|nr:Crp/Fnr family transcriptional regulator [Adlercreutzia sp.]
MDSKLFKFIDTDLYPAVFTTEALLAQDELPFTRRRYRKGEVIFRAEECHPYTYHVASGLVRLFLSSPEGAVKTLFCHAAGTQFAFQGFKRDRTTKSTA